MSQLGNDTSRCKGIQCPNKRICARYMDKPDKGTKQVPWSDLTAAIHDGVCPYWIKWEGK